MANLQSTSLRNILATTPLGSVLRWGRSILELCIIWLVVSTTCRLLTEHLEYEQVREGQKCWKYLVAAFLCSVAASVLAGLVHSVFLAMLCSLASAVAEIISYVKFLGFLKHSRDKV